LYVLQVLDVCCSSLGLRLLGSGAGQARLAIAFLVVFVLAIAVFAFT